MRLRSAPTTVAFASAALAVLGAAAAARAEEAEPDDERYSLRGELGGEYDSNAHRTERIGDAQVPVTDSAAARLVLSGALADTVAQGQDLSLAATLAGKLYENQAARDEDVAVAESAVAWRLRLGARTAVTLGGHYYEAFQRAAGELTYVSERRDFRSLTPSLRLVRVLGGGIDVGVGAGYRFFVFKPDRDFDFTAPALGADLRWAREAADGAAEWEATVAAAFERRGFAGPALVNACVPPSSIGSDCLPTPAERTLRGDDFLMARAELVRTGRVLLGAGYALSDNRSNSYGETVMRHFATLRFAAALPWELFVVARAELLFASYAERVVVGVPAVAGSSFVSIEEENRNSVRVDLSRNLGDRLQLLARYTFYANELGGSTGTYRRHTALLSLAFTLEK